MSRSCEKQTLWRALNVEEDIAISLTESCAMIPPCSVSGMYFGHPEAKYFRVSKVGKDQIEDYSQRKSMTIDRVENWLAPYL